MITTFSPIPEGFFGESGLTATSANHIANLLKLRYDSIERELGCLNFVAEKMSIVGSETESVMRSATVLDANEIRVKLDAISRCKGFIAFLREAIKCKGELTREIEDYAIERPEAPEIPTPQRAIDNASVIASMSIGERVKYLAVEAKAATYGKFIHPGGVLDNARDRAFDAFAEPTKVAMAGRDTVFVKRESAMSSTEIDAIMDTLQSVHRKAEAELNGYKHAIEEKVTKDAQDKLDAFRSAKSEYDSKMTEWRKECADIEIAEQQARADRRKVIEALKIVVPGQYYDLYEEING